MLKVEVDGYNYRYRYRCRYRCMYRYNYRHLYSYTLGIIRNWHEIHLHAHHSAPQPVALARMGSNAAELNLYAREWENNHCD